MLQLRTFILAALFILGGTALRAQNLNFELRSTVNFPGQTLANVCGWTSPDGREYALVGASKGLVIVDITDPVNPVQIVQIPGPDNLWKEIKTYSHYAYVTSEGGGAVQIVDLSGLPSSNLNFHNYADATESGNPMTNIHALHIDVTKGFLYTYGGNYSHTLVHDLKVDPYNPVYVGKFDALGYIHDGYADNDTLYACHIYTGILSIVDMTDKTAPVVLGTVETPGKFTHNSWLLSDHKHILTTDETTPSFVTSYDISDPTDIKELDRFSIDNGNGSLGHNVQVINDYTVTSWYTGGVVITDCHRPANLVKVGQYDTWDGTGPGFDGCWGAFPYFPSGTVIASNIEPGDLFILTPTYKRACYLEGVVKNGCNGQPLIDATVTVVNGDPLINTTSNNAGVVKTGQVTPGTFTVQVSKPGYVTQEFQATLATAEVATFDITLQPTSAYNVSGVVTLAGQPLANIPVTISNAQQTYNLTSNASGVFSVECVTGGTYSVSAGQWGYVNSAQTVVVNGDEAVNIQLTEGYYDDFTPDYGWTTSATSPTGLWERGTPIGSTINNALSNPNMDVSTDGGTSCFVTGNSGGQAGTDDVDNGTVTLTCPPMQLAGYNDAILNFYYWFFNGGGNGTALNDHFEVRVSNGTQDVQLLNVTTPASAWMYSGDIHLSDYITLNDNVRVSFIAADNDPGHVVDAAVDVFSVTPVTTSGVNDALSNVQLMATPNPSSTAFSVRFDWPEVTAPIIEVRNALGQVIVFRQLNNATGMVTLGADWAAGVYTVVLKNGEQQGQMIRLVKGK